MKLTIPDDIMRQAAAGEWDVRLALAVQFYADNRLDHADACRLAGMTPDAFNEELLRHGLGVQQYPRVDLAAGRPAGSAA